MSNRKRINFLERFKFRISKIGHDGTIQENSYGPSPINKSTSKNTVENTNPIYNYKPCTHIINLRGLRRDFAKFPIEISKRNTTPELARIELKPLKKVFSNASMTRFRNKHHNILYCKSVTKLRDKNFIIPKYNKEFNLYDSKSFKGVFRCLDLNCQNYKGRLLDKL